jgi:hypothetical protein
MTTPEKKLTQQPPGHYHQVLKEHFTNMSWIQQRVCTAAIDEYEALAKRESFLKSENDKLISNVAGLTKRLLTRKPKLAVREKNGSAARVTR